MLYLVFSYHWAWKWNCVGNWLLDFGLRDEKQENEPRDNHIHEQVIHLIWDVYLRLLLNGRWYTGIDLQYILVCIQFDPSYYIFQAHKYVRFRNLLHGKDYIHSLHHHNHLYIHKMHQELIHYQNGSEFGDRYHRCGKWYCYMSESCARKTGRRYFPGNSIQNQCHRYLCIFHRFYKESDWYLAQENRHIEEECKYSSVR